MEERLSLGSPRTWQLQPDLSDSLRAGLIAGLAVVVAIYLALGIAFLRALPAPAFDLTLPPNGEFVSTGAPVILQTVGWGTTIETIRLVEFPLDADGRVLGEREIPVRYEPITSGRLPGETRGVLVRADGQPLLALDAWYELRVEGYGHALSWRGLRRVPVTVEAAFGTPRTPVPRFAADTVVTYGQPFAIAWNVPIAEVHYAVRPATPTRTWQSEDGTVTYIALDEFQQGTRYEVEITDARATTGVPLRQPVVGSFTTPAALRVVSTTPANGARDVATGEDPVLTFSAPVANPEAVEEAITIDPPVEGTFRWLAPNRVQFVTEKSFPYSTDVRLTVRGGPESLRAVDGGFLEDDFQLAYRTQPHKRIDVDLTRQTVSLLEDGRVVFTTLASTGMRGAETPTGTFTIQYKLPKTRMRGVNPNGVHYDIPDVPWVMALFGDYTLHGAPWRQAWGVPLSNGCVSMPTAAAKYVYDWAPVGTPVTIHY
ncbi:MAG TPA: L,D-transpeptidase family protein [Chloroflexota bacterium]|nr:L,D-transpeptidase family protein [Chloroflexota bacterium]